MAFLVDTETAVIANFSGVANTFGAGLLATFRPAFVAGFTIWITLIAYEVAFGKSEDGFTYIFTKIGKVFLIGVFALYGFPELSEILNGVKDGFVGASTVSAVLETNLTVPLENLWSELFRWFAQAFVGLGFTDVTKALQLVLVFILLFLSFALLTIAVFIFAAIALAMFLVANSVFVLLLAIGPFFLLCLAFPFTQRFFETYIGNVMTAILGMALTVLMILFVANLFSLSTLASVIPRDGTVEVVFRESKSLAISFVARFGTALLVIYLYYKVFDLAAALGGGLNMGNNMIGGVRSIMRDFQKSSGGGSSSSKNTNQVSQTGGALGAPARAAGGNRTLTGMAASAAGSAIGTVGGGAITAAKNIGSAAASAGRYAYNRYSQNQNRISK